MLTSQHLKKRCDDEKNNSINHFFSSFNELQILFSRRIS